MKHYEIGKTVPLDYPRGILGEDISPVWHALLVAPQKERAVCEYLKRKDVYAFYPSQERKWRLRGKTYRRTVPIVSTHVYALFRREPQWDVMKEQRRLITGVFSIGGRPVEIPSDIVKHLQGLTVSAERLRQARMELLRIQPGDHAQISSGPLEDFLVEIEKVEGGLAWFHFLSGGLKGSKGRADIDSLRKKVSPDDEKKLLQDVVDGSILPPTEPE